LSEFTVIDGKTTLKYVPEVVDQGQSESILAESPAPRRAITVPNFLVFIGIRQGDGSVKAIGVGWREAEYLFTAAHLTHLRGRVGYGVNNLVLFNDKFTTSIDLNDNVFTLQPNGFCAHTGFDIMAVKVPAAKWSQVGTRSISSSGYSFETSGSIEIYGAPDGRALVSTGVLVDDSDLSTMDGLIAHSASTCHSFSGSPIIRPTNGMLKICGCHTLGGEKENFGSGAWSVHFLREQLGLSQKSRVGAVWELLSGPAYLDSETPHTKGKQARWERGLMMGITPGKNPALGRRANARDKQEYQAQQRQGASENDKTFEKIQHDWSELIQNTQAGISDRQAGTNYPEDRYRPFVASQSYTVGQRRADEGNASRWADEETAKCKQVSAPTTPFGLGFLPPSPPAVNTQLAFQVPDPERAAHNLIGSIEESPLVSNAKPATAAQYGLSSGSTASCSSRRTAARAARPHSVPIDSPVRYQDVPTRHAPYSHNISGPPKWARTVDDTVPIDMAEKLLGTTYEGDRLADMEMWMKSGDWLALGRLRGSGCQWMLDLAQFAGFKAYIGSGNIHWDHPKTRKEGKEYFLNKRGEEHARRCGTITALAKRKDKNGVSKERTEPKLVSQETIDLVKASSKGAVDLTGYCLPPEGVDPIRKSLASQLKRQSPGNWDVFMRTPGFHEKLADFVGCYTPGPPGIRRSVGEIVDDYLASMDGTKSAGFSSRHRPGTKSVWAATREARDELVYLVMCRLALRTGIAESIGFLSAADIVRFGLKDLETPHLKDEAHDPEKAKAERWRIIWGASIVDACTMEVTHHEQNKRDIADFQRGDLSCSAVGMGHDDKGVSRLGSVFDNMSGAGKKPLGFSDASGWDLSVCRDAFVFDAERRALRTTAHELWDVNADLLYAEAMCMSAHVLILGSALIEFTIYGIMASGIPSTSASNTPIRSFSLRVAGADDAIAMSDDEVHTGAIDVDLLATAGTITKGDVKFAVGGQPIDFTSHDFLKIVHEGGSFWIASFKNIRKLLAHIDLRREGDLPPGVDQLAGSHFAVRNNPAGVRLLTDFCVAKGWTLPLPADIPLNL